MAFEGLEEAQEVSYQQLLARVAAGAACLGGGAGEMVALVVEEGTRRARQFSRVSKLSTAAVVAFCA